MKSKGLLRKLQMTQHQLQMTANESKLNQNLKFAIESSTKIKMELK